MKNRRFFKSLEKIQEIASEQRRLEAKALKLQSEAFDGVFWKDEKKHQEWIEVQKKLLEMD